MRLANTVERTGVIRRCTLLKTGGKYDVGVELAGARWPDNVVPSQE
jgi:hypothetical protein